MKKNYIIFIAILLLCTSAAVIFAGCTTARPDPETGIISWIAAVNNHDYDRVYDLAPQAVRQQVSRPMFLAAQHDNPFLASGNSVQGYAVLNKTMSGNNAAITAQLDLHKPAADNESARDIALYIKFVEVFENGKWDVWTTAP
jgi:hypothetical protein